MAAIRVTKSYASLVNQFLRRLEQDQRTALESNGQAVTVDAYIEMGRKFDKVVLEIADKRHVRYFIQKSDGSIYGAKSPQAPNLSWYFGTLSSALKWAWGDYHGVPVEDTSVRLVKSYGGFKHYMRVEEK